MIDLNNLKMPEGWLAQDEHWIQLTGSIFQLLEDAIARNQPLDFPNLQNDIESWEKFVEFDEDVRDKREKQWNDVRCILWCAQNRDNPPPVNEIGHVSSVLSDTHDFIKGREGWVWDCIRIFRKEPVEKIVKVPVAICKELREDKGSIATLVLELIKPGGGRLFQHPKDTPSASFDSKFKSFEESMKTAFRAALNLGVDGSYDGRFRLLDNKGNPIRNVSGDSASGAAALASRCALLNYAIDDRIIVLANTNADGDLGNVDGISAKVEAIVNNPSYKFDKIIVATSTAATEVEEKLKELSQKGIEVKAIGKLKDAVGERSKLGHEVLSYLKQVALKAGELPAFYPKHLKANKEGKTRFDDIRQVVQVVEDRSAFEKWIAKEREWAQAAGMPFEKYGYSNRTRLELGEQDMKSSDRPAPPKTATWDKNAGSNYRRAVVLSDPAIGKTWLLRYEARRIACEDWSDEDPQNNSKDWLDKDPQDDTAVAKRLKERKIGLNDVVLPIFTRLSNVNERNSSVEKALVDIVSEGRSEAFREFVEEKLNENKCVVLLDALDEVQSRGELRNKLDAFSVKFPQLRILMTSRIVGYEGSPIKDAEGKNAQELELLAFETPQIESFVKVWFGDDEETAAEFLSMLRDNFQVKGLARIPLMLSLMCRVYQARKENKNQNGSSGQKQNNEFPTRRTELYKECLRGLLKDWKKEKGHKVEIEVSEGYVDALIELLQVVGYELFIEGREQFSESLLRKKMKPWLKRLGPSDELYGKNAALIIEELKRDGIFVLSIEGKDPSLLFLHRTFHEYLTACALSEQGWENIEKLIDKKAWLPKWREVIVLLAGQLTDPIPLFDILTNEKTDDYFSNRLALSAFCLSEINSKIRESNPKIESRIDQITSAAFLLWWKYKTKGIDGAVPHITQTLRTLGRVNGKIKEGRTEMSLIEWLIKKLSNDAAYVRGRAAEALGAMGEVAARHPEVLPLLVKALSDSNGNVRSSAADELSKIMAKGIRYIKKKSESWISLRDEWETKSVKELSEE